MDYFIDFIILILVYFLLFYKKWRKKSKKDFVINTLMYAYVVMVIFVTLMPVTIPFNGTNNLFFETANLIPFRDLRLNYDGAITDIILNIIMMVPLGFLFPIIKKKGALDTVVTAFLFSLIIECFQLLCAWSGGLHSRSFDVTDLITNTIGGLIGFITFCIFRTIFNKKLMND